MWNACVILLQFCWSAISCDDKGRDIDQLSAFYFSFNLIKVNKIKNKIDCVRHLNHKKWILEMQITGYINELSVLSLQHRIYLNEFIVKNNGKSIESSASESLYCSAPLRTRVAYFVKLKTWFDWIYRFIRHSDVFISPVHAAIAQKGPFKWVTPTAGSCGTVYVIGKKIDETNYQDVPNRRI